jgi:acyl-[acyl-carrier-protein]-phospholipid O-acyltransferase / long-chain-fatty-acid--[acyl-carrier-protein] ligase
VKGGNRMLGYLKQPDLDREVLRDGWYVTGDIAAIDEDGFITVTDRLSRFSKIAGEMVPHLKIEETMSRILDDQGCIVTAVPDEAKGEKLVAFYTKREVTPQELWSKLNESDLPKLWIPKRENLRIIDALPVLGTGKVNLREIKTMALEPPASPAAPASSPSEAPTKLDEGGRVVA